MIGKSMMTFVKEKNAKFGDGPLKTIYQYSTFEYIVTRTWSKPRSFRMRAEAAVPPDCL